MIETEQLIQMSKYAGERFDLIQAGGGNSSVKLSDGTMLIKASGVHLSDMSKTIGIAEVDNKKIVDFMDDQSIDQLPKKKRELLAAKAISDATLTPDLKASIETPLHSLLKKYTLHTHPLIVNAVTCKSNGQQLLREWFKDAVFIPYATPGIDLALSMKTILRQCDVKGSTGPQIIFLQNHGLIISSDNSEDIYTTKDQVADIIAGKLNIDLSRYKLTNVISNMVNQFSDELMSAYLSEDEKINSLLKADRSLFFSAPFCPDKLVYCGISAVELDILDNAEPIKKYQNEYRALPRVIVYKNHLFFMANNIRKAMEAEEVLKFHVMVMNIAGRDVNCLSEEEVSYLSNWDAEKFRQEL